MLDMRGLSSRSLGCGDGKQRASRARDRLGEGGYGSRRLVFTPRQVVTWRLSSLRTSLRVENRLFNLIIG